MDDDLNLSPIELAVMSLTVFIVISIILQNTITINKEMLKLLNWFDLICSSIFLIEWSIRFKNAKNKTKFVIRNFIDLLASFPLTYLQGFKALRLLKLLQIIRVFGSISRFVTYCKNNQIQTAKFVLFILFILLLLISPIMILFFEYESGSINTAENALWWTYCTITTIGYGDLYPVTTGGRIFTIFVSLGGIGMFGIISSLIVNYIIHLNNETSNNNS